MAQRRCASAQPNRPKRRRRKRSAADAGRTHGARGARAAPGCLLRLACRITRGARARRAKRELGSAPGAKPRRFPPTAMQPRLGAGKGCKPPHLAVLRDVKVGLVGPKVELAARAKGRLEGRHRAGGAGPVDEAYCEVCTRVCVQTPREDVASAYIICIAQPSLCACAASNPAARATPKVDCRKPGGRAPPCVPGTAAAGVQQD